MVLACALRLLLGPPMCSRQRSPHGIEKGTKLPPTLDDCVTQTSNPNTDCNINAKWIRRPSPSLHRWTNDWHWCGSPSLSPFLRGANHGPW
eukprot:1558524-Amphidinium_carterae.1